MQVDVCLRVCLKKSFIGKLKLTYSELFLVLRNMLAIKQFSGLPDGRESPLVKFIWEQSRLIKLATIKQNHSEMAAENCFSLDEFLGYF